MASGDVWQPARRTNVKTHIETWNKLRVAWDEGMNVAVALMQPLTTTKMNNARFNCTSTVMWVLALGLTWGSLSEAHAQYRGYRMGMSIEPNVAWMVSRDFEHVAEGARAHFGWQFTADVLFTETYAIGTGVHVFRTGSAIQYWEATSDSTVSRVSRNFNNQYVELPLTFKLRTKEIGYTTYYGKFGGGLGLNIRREAEEDRYLAYERVGEDWVELERPATNPELISGDFASLFRTSLIVGMGLERTIAGNTAVMVGLTYNTSLFSTHQGQELVQTDQNGQPRLEGETPATSSLIGHDSIMSLTLGIVF